MNETVNKARSWDKSPDIKILIFSGLGRNWREKEITGTFFFREHCQLKFDVYGTETMRISENQDRKLRIKVNISVLQELDWSQIRKWGEIKK